MSEKELTCLIYFTFPESYASMAPDVIREDRFAVSEALFRKEKISIGKAAEISGVSYEEFREHTLRRR
jgi:predicted HTH domain antitoxin